MLVIELVFTCIKGFDRARGAIKSLVPWNLLSFCQQKINTIAFCWTQTKEINHAWDNFFCFLGFWQNLYANNSLDSSLKTTKQNNTESHFWLDNQSVRPQFALTPVICFVESSLFWTVFERLSSIQHTTLFALTKEILRHCWSGYFPTWLFQASIRLHWLLKSHPEVSLWIGRFVMLCLDFKCLDFKLLQVACYLQCTHKRCCEYTDSGLWIQVAIHTLRKKAFLW